MKQSRIFGWSIMIFGILGLMPLFLHNNKIFGLFEVDTLLRLLYILSGVFALVSSKKEIYARRFFKILLFVFFVITVFGFIGGDNVLGIIGVNLASNILHVVITVLLLYLSFLQAKWPMNKSI